ncbi:hypothetical protein [Streptomyces chattanoogensis]|nr:hypothetical protein [Streptomyces chattanoogensis]
MRIIFGCPTDAAEVLCDGISVKVNAGGSPADLVPLNALPVPQVSSVRATPDPGWTISAEWREDGGPGRSSNSWIAAPDADYVRFISRNPQKNPDVPEQMGLVISFDGIPITQCAGIAHVTVQARAKRGNTEESEWGAEHRLVVVKTAWRKTVVPAPPLTCFHGDRSSYPAGPVSAGSPVVLNWDGPTAAVFGVQYFHDAYPVEKVKDGLKNLAVAGGTDVFLYEIGLPESRVPDTAGDLLSDGEARQYGQGADAFWAYRAEGMVWLPACLSAVNDTRQYVLPSAIRSQLVKDTTLAVRFRCLNGGMVRQERTTTTLNVDQPQLLHTPPHRGPHRGRHWHAEL